MNIYAVHFRDKETREYEAESYTLQDGKFYFHKGHAKNDFDSFANESDVIGIDNLGNVNELYGSRGGGIS